MFDFLADNGGSILAGGILLAMVILIIVKMVKDWRAGRVAWGCGGDCSGCPGAACNSREEERK